MAASVAAPAPRILTARRAAVTLLFGLAIVGGALAGVFLGYESDLPQVSSLEDFQPNIITQVFAADGTVLGEFAIEKRVVVGFKGIPPVLRNAIVAVEDADFWKHLGINPWRIPGAALANFRSGRKEQGSSTLTMQLSRLLFLTPEKTYERKIMRSSSPSRSRRTSRRRRSSPSTATRSTSATATTASRPRASSTSASPSRT